MKILDLKDPYPNGYEHEDDPEALKFLEIINEAYTALHENRLFVEFIDGDRKGSIAKVIPNSRYIQKPPSTRYSTSFLANKRIIRVDHSYLYGICKWTGRSNKFQIRLPHRDVKVMLDYDGPTVYELFDAKAAKEKVLEEPNQTDIDGNILEIGDKVLYLNIRYGSRSELSKGFVKEFKAVVNTSKTTITTVIQNDKNDELSELHFSSSMVYKL